MKIRITYRLYTDGDYSLQNPDIFGCTAREITIDDEYFDYVGAVEFEHNDVWRCKDSAKTFLKKFLCDGIHISYTHYWLMESFYNVINELINFISKNDSGVFFKCISGNQEGTGITVKYIS